jgi:hypothetical protein
MLTLPPGSRVFLATDCVDGRKGIDGLSVIVRSQFGEDPLSGTLFVFFSKRADRVRVVLGRDAYVLTLKRLEVGTFRRVRDATSGELHIGGYTLSLWPFSGVGLHSSCAQPRPRCSATRFRACFSGGSRCATSKPEAPAFFGAILDGFRISPRSSPCHSSSLSSKTLR